MLKILDEITTRRTKLRLLRQKVVEQQPLFAALEEIEEVTLGMGTYADCVHLSFSGDVALLRKVWFILRQHGYQPSHRPTEEDRASFHTFWRKDEQVAIWMSFSSSHCKLVKTGTRMVEEPVYEVHCGDNPIAAPSVLAELGV